ncbi:MAG: ribosome recycling factor [Chloroflexi bacterium]|nr:ribosome recycling factor [Chloroflexota bacterium]
MIENVISNSDSKMKKAVEALKKELATLRTGRASPALVEHLQVDYYGVPTPLNQIASISTPEPRLIVVQPWDRQILTGIEKSILKSSLGLNPSNDGTVIRIPIPPLNEERRRDLTRLVHKRVEEHRVAIRNVRRDAVEELRVLEKNKQISQDDNKRAMELLQKLHDKYVLEGDEIGKAKEAELMEV